MDKDLKLNELFKFAESHLYDENIMENHMDKIKHFEDSIRELVSEFCEWKFVDYGNGYKSYYPKCDEKPNCRIGVSRLPYDMICRHCGRRIKIVQ